MDDICLNVNVDLNLLVRFDAYHAVSKHMLKQRFST